MGKQSWSCDIWSGTISWTPHNILNNLNSEDKLSLLVKAAEVVRDEAAAAAAAATSSNTKMASKPSKQSNTEDKISNAASSATASHNFTTLSAFVNSASFLNKQSLNSSGSLSLSGDQTSGTTDQSNGPTMFIGKNGKPTRPFKAYPKEPLTLQLQHQHHDQQQQRQSNISLVQTSDFNNLSSMHSNM